MDVNKMKRGHKMYSILFLLAFFLHSSYNGN